MVQIQKNISLSIPDYCPKCNYRLCHVNALDTRAKVYFVYCPDSGCRWCREYKQCSNCGELICI